MSNTSDISRSRDVDSGCTHLMSEKGVEANLKPRGFQMSHECFRVNYPFSSKKDNPSANFPSDLSLDFPRLYGISCY